MKDFDSANFEAEVLKSQKPVLVDFWAEWCVPCKAVMPVIDQLATEYSGKMIFGKVDVERSPQIAKLLGIRSVPTVLLFSKGEEMERIVGSHPKDHFQKKIDLYAGK
jgi:thioredoxin 1